MVQEGQSRANIIHYVDKGKGKVVSTTNFKRTNNSKKKVNMKDITCFVCGETGHWAKKYRKRMGKKNHPV